MENLFIVCSITGFLKAVGIIVIVYYGLKLVGRLLFPVVVKRAVHNMQARQYTYQERKPEGQVTVEKGAGAQRSSRATQGEYVDFEEVD